MSNINMRFSPVLQSAFDPEGRSGFDIWREVEGSMPELVDFCLESDAAEKVFEYQSQGIKCYREEV